MNFLKKTFKYILVMTLATVFVTIGIDAADHLDNLSESMVGRVLFASSGPCPSDMVFVPYDNGGFCIDIYEASANNSCPNQFPANQQDTRINLTSAGCASASAPGKSPWVYISQSQAREACARAGKRLPTNDEWFAASLGTPDIKSANWETSDCQLSSNWTNQPGQTGSGETCVSSYGAYDMIGNVWEWVVGEIVDGKFNGKELPESGYIEEVDINGLPTISNKNNPDANFNDDYFWMKETGTRGMARGGFWDNKKEGGIYSTYLVSQPSFAGTGVGFRCVK